MKTRLAAFIFLISALLRLSAGELSVKQIMSEAEIRKVLSGEIITRMYLKYNALLENTDNFIKVPQTPYTRENFDEYEMVTDEKAFIPYDLENRSKLDFYNLISSPANLKGTKYYSRTEDEIKQLIVDSFPIDERNRKIDEVKHSQIEKHITGRFRQKDNRFGTLNFKSDLYNEGNNFVMIVTCEDSIPFVSGKDEYKIYSFFIYDEEHKGFYYYSVYVMRIKTEMFLKRGGLKTLSPKTFSNRLRAASVQIASLLGLDWSDKYNPWK